MKKLVFLLFIIIGFTNAYEYEYSLSEQIQTRTGKCKEEYKFCMPFFDSFIIQQLKQTSVEYKMQKINEQIPHYANVPMKINSYNDKGFGLYTLQNLKPGDIMFEFDQNTVLSNQKINLKNKFRKSINYLKNIDLRIFPKKNFEYKSNALILQIFYQFANFESSFHKDHLLGLPYQDFSLLYTITDYEAHLLYDDIKLYKKIKSNQKWYKSAYNTFMKIIFSKLSQEQFTLIFRRDDILIDDYIYLSYIIGSRAHDLKLNQKLNLFPILHYLNLVNEISDYQVSKFELQQKQRNRKILVKNLRNLKSLQEIAINYHVTQPENLLIYFGFVPHKIQKACIDVYPISKEMSTKYFLPYINCINLDLDINKAYQMVNIGQNLVDYDMKREFMELVMGNLRKTKSEEDLIQIYSGALDDWLQKEIEIKNNIWDPVFNQLQDILMFYKQQFNKFHSYLQFRRSNRISVENAQNLKDYYHFQINQIIQIQTQINDLQG